MITTSSEYTSWLINEALHTNREIFSQNSIIIPKDEPILEIDLDTRKIINPANGTITNVTLDHQAEIIFFKINRYFQTIDLANINVAGFIIYETADKRVVAYQIPIYYIDKDDNDKILFPWILTNSATAVAGTLTFAVSFIGYDINQDSTKTINFRLNTLISTLEIEENDLIHQDITGFEILSANKQEHYFEPESIEDVGQYIVDLQQRINEIAEQTSQDQNIYWIDAT